MKATLFISAISLIFTYGVWWYSNTATICPAPIAYHLGLVDPRFGVSRYEALAVLEKAESIWEKEAGFQLFVYDDTSDFPVNFIYDERQKEASTEEAWRISLDTKEAATKVVFSGVEFLKSAYNKKLETYEQVRARYESDLASYNNEVEIINGGGGATEAEFKELKLKKDNLNKARNLLLSQQEDLNQAGSNLNQAGEAANKLVVAYNAEVERYNSVYGERSETFTQGDYRRDRINVYTFSTKTELTTVLAHEFGHALGIGHVEGGASLMYYLMADQPPEPSLSPEDKAALIAVCGDGTDMESTARRYIRSILLYF